MGGLWAASSHGHVGEETATASLVERRGEGVDRRAAHQDSRRSRNDGSSPSADRGGGRDGAADSLAGGGVRPTLRAAAARGAAGGAAERLRVDATARLAGHAVVEIGTHYLAI